MKIIRADISNADEIYHITQRTITESYAHYYPASVVDFIARFHHKERILGDIRDGQIYLLYDEEGKAAATGTAKGDEISRLFVLPEYQRRGYGSELMNILEDLVLKEHSRIQLDASLPAKPMYIKRGYTDIEYVLQPVGGGDFVCYTVMELTR